VTAKDGSVYNVDLSHNVTISQPQYPYMASFSDTSVSGDKIPANILPNSIVAVPNAGGNWVITLPKANNMTLTWTESRKDSKTENEKTVSGPTKYTYYEQWSYWGRTLYQEYSYTETVKQADEVLTTTDVTYRITGWKIGDTRYNLGDTVIVNQNITIIAEVTREEKAPVVTSNILTTTTREYYRGSDSTSKPSGASGTVSSSLRDTIDDIYDNGKNKTVVSESRTPKS